MPAPRTASTCSSRIRSSSAAASARPIGAIVEAFSRTPSRRLVVIGDGPEHAKIRALAGPNVTLLGYQPFEVLHDHLQRARAFVFAAEEDFGISPVEAQACGTPVIAYGKGGVCESVRATGDHPTGLFYGAQTSDALLDALARFEALPAGSFDPRACRANAERFSAARFRSAFARLVLEAYAGLRAELAAPMLGAPFDGDAGEASADGGPAARGAAGQDAAGTGLAGQDATRDGAFARA